MEDIRKPNNKSNPAGTTKTELPRKNSSIISLLSPFNKLEEYRAPTSPSKNNNKPIVLKARLACNF